MLRFYDDEISTSLLLGVQRSAVVRSLRQRG